jgi:hypothetical protein
MLFCLHIMNIQIFNSYKIHFMQRNIAFVLIHFKQY